MTKSKVHKPQFKMLIKETANITSRDVWIQHPQGRIFSRIWSPGNNACSSKDTPIVLFHDSLGCVDLWRKFPAKLCEASGLRVIAYDRLGFGRSEARDDILQFDFVAQEAKTFFPVIRKQLNFREFIAFGHSVGGGMGINCAAEFPKDCLALITESAQAYNDERIRNGIKLAKRDFQDPEQFQRLKRYHGEKARWVLDAWTETWLHPEFAVWSLADVLPQVASKLLAIHGDLDEYGSHHHPMRLSQLCGGHSQIEIMKNTHHVPHREHSEKVVNIVADFIKAHSYHTVPN